MGALNRQVTELKMALVAAKRNVPAKTEKIVPDPAHIARIAQIEKEAARVPGLLKELEDLRKASPKAQKKAEPKKIDAGPTQLPKNVYRMHSSTLAPVTRSCWGTLLVGLAVAGTRSSTGFPVNSTKLLVPVNIARALVA